MSPTREEIIAIIDTKLRVRAGGFGTTRFIGLDEVAANVLALFKEGRSEQEAENERLRADVFRPGVMRCAKCEFRLIRNVLYAQTGNVGAGTSETEPCPNGCGPLWPVTWKDECQAADRLWGQQVERAVKAEADLAAAKLRIQGLEEKLTWRPIETAPHSYHPPLSHYNHHAPQILGLWGRAFYCVCSWGGPSNPQWLGSDNRPVPFQPERWLPLPEAPLLATPDTTPPAAEEA